MSEPYVSLHNHFISSPMDGMLRYDQAAEFAVQNHMPGLALTDHGTLAGVPAFFTACKKQGVKPIIGMEAYVVPNHRDHSYFKGPSGREVRSGYHLTLLAKNLTGYKNLVRLNNIAFLDGFHGWPKVDLRDLEAHKDGLMVLSGCPSSELCRLILAGKQTEATQFYGRLSELFKQDLGLEVMSNSMRDDMQRTANIGLLQLARKFQAMIVPTNDAHYLKAEHRTFHDEMFKLNQWNEDPVEGKKKEKDEDKGKKKVASNWRKGYDGLYHLKTPDEMAAAFSVKEFGDCIPNTLRVAERVEEYEIFDKSSKLPRQIPNAEQILGQMASAGLRSKGLSEIPEYQARMERELNVVQKLGFSSYFLTTREIVEIIRSLKCPVGWGRGSGGSSLICYSLGITDVDPIRHHLLFERFISEDRPEWPDIDLDVPETRRSEILGKLLERYGADKISYISVAHTFRPKMVIRDLCRTFGIQQSDPKLAAKWSGLVPFEYEDYDKSIKGTELETEMAKDQQGLFILQAFRELCGVQRHVGTHASGIVISSEPIADFLPVRQEEVELGGRKVKMMISQYTMDWLDKFGCVKFDVLGLTKLDTVYGAAAEVGIDLKRIPMDDPEAFKLIGEGKVEGLFQLDKSVVCVELCRQIKPRNMDELATILAINRPGVLGSGQYEVYLRRRRGVEEAKFAHPGLAEILKETYGVCIFQEDLMRIAEVCAGYSAVEAYKLLKGIAKKDMELVRPHVVELEKRMKERGMAAEVIKQITDQMTAAGRYAFNRSHAECYAYLSYACAYLSCHYPLAFYKWLITMAGDEEERVKYVSAALGRGIAVLPPHVNQSGVGFTIEGNSLRVGLRSVRGVGEITAQEIIAKRPFADAGQVVKSVNRGVYAALCAAGALQGLPDLDQNPPAAKLEEIAVLGMSLGGGKTYEEEIRRLKAVSFHEIQEESKAVVMIISTVKKHIDKNKHAMAFLTMLDVHGPRGEGVMFADTYKQNPPREDVLYWGIMSRTPKGFIVHQIMEIERLREMWKMQDAAKKEGR